MPSTIRTGRWGPASTRGTRREQTRSQVRSRHLRTTKEPRESSSSVRRSTSDRRPAMWPTVRDADPIVPAGTNPGESEGALPFFISSVIREAEPMLRIVRRSLVLGMLALFAAVSVHAQGTLADYQRAEKFLPGNARHLYTTGSVMPDWIVRHGGQARDGGQGSTDRSATADKFWYPKVTLAGDKIETQFVVVDAANGTSTPAFDQTRLAEALSKAMHSHVEAMSLPFEEFEFTEDGKAIRFELQNSEWTCNIEKYDCMKGEPTNANEYESRSPDGRWAAFVDNHNLFLRDTSTGTTEQLTTDGAPGWDYATPLPSLRAYVAQQTQDPKERPAVFWAPDSSKFVTYRIDSRHAGRFTSLQFVPPNQIRPQAFSVVY